MIRRTFTIAALLLSISLCTQAQNAASRTEPVKPGSTAPDFTLTDTSGKAVTLSSIKQPTVLVFYRGYW